MKNKNLIRMTSLLGVLTMTGCGIPNMPAANNNNIISTEPVTAIAPENYSGGQKAPEEGMVPGENEINALSNASLNVFYNTLKPEEDANKNVLLSPASLSFALAIAENGAGGDTLSQMEKYVNGGIKINDMNPLLNYTSYKLNNEDKVSWKVANSVWFNDDGTCRMNDEFLRRSIEYYDAEIYEKPFDASIVGEINNWVSRKTDKMIENIINDCSDDAIMFIVNAIAFEGEWEEKYEDRDIIENVTFTNADGSESKVTQLYSLEGRYFELGDGIGFIKPYKGGEYSFVGILPEEGVSTEDYIAGLLNNNEDFSKAIREAEYHDVDVYLPEFNTDYDVEMTDIYEGMGMTDPFKDNKADFTGMFEGEDMNAYIGKILHKTHIEVDREGTKAAAATVVEMDKCTAIPVFEDPIIINLNRPFVYAIVDNETGIPVFLGCQNSMK